MVNLSLKPRRHDRAGKVHPGSGVAAKIQVLGNFPQCLISIICLQLAAASDTETRVKLARQTASFLTDPGNDPLERDNLLNVALQLADDTVLAGQKSPGRTLDTLQNGAQGITVCAGWG